MQLFFALQSSSGFSGLDIPVMSTRRSCDEDPPLRE